MTGAQEAVGLLLLLLLLVELSTGASALLPLLLQGSGPAAVAAAAGPAASCEGAAALHKQGTALQERRHRLDFVAVFYISLQLHVGCWAGDTGENLDSCLWMLLVA